MAKDSIITNCYFILPTGNAVSAATGRGPAIFEPGGTTKVTLDGMLIAPLHLFTTRQLRALEKRNSQEAPPLTKSP